MNEQEKYFSLWWQHQDQTKKQLNEVYKQFEIIQDIVFMFFDPYDNTQIYYYNNFYNNSDKDFKKLKANIKKALKFDDRNIIKDFLRDRNNQDNASDFLKFYKYKLTNKYNNILLNAAKKLPFEIREFFYSEIYNKMYLYSNF